MRKLKHLLETKHFTTYDQYGEELCVFKKSDYEDILKRVCEIDVVMLGLAGSILLENQECQDDEERCKYVVPLALELAKEILNNYQLKLV
jgi:hypothetical protein